MQRDGGEDERIRAGAGEDGLGLAGEGGGGEGEQGEVRDVL